ncbi:hypothetical protein [Rubrivirga sp. IMCC45206]|uniref:hypothetical protein n=1 Tax=Rubrivirga sp. IMCC45206 TaxID=3391614 RepID=UPI00398FF6F7
MLRTLPCCVDVPREGPLVRYGLEELLRGLGLAPAWVGRGDARLVLATDPAGADGLVLRVTPQASADLATPRLPAVDALGWLAVDGERWPVPVGPPGEATLGDAVAGAAWWLAGLQERATAARDAHGRVAHADSLQSRLDGPGGATRPAVDAVRRALGHALRARGVEAAPLGWGGAPWAVALTHDLDALRLHRLRALAGGLRQLRPALAVRRAFGPDRRRASLDALEALSRRHGDGATWFVKPGRWGPHDPPVDLGAHAARVRALPGEVGWHPGYGAHDSAGRLAAEHAVFVDAVGAPPALARTHFLRWAEPETPRLLAATGVRLDSTLGWADAPGFRRGTAHPFRLFDLDAGRPTALWEMPLALMDTTLTTYQRLDAEAQANALAAVAAGAREAGGCAVVLWHNQLGADDRAWGRRLDTLDHALGHARRQGAAIGPLGTLLDGHQGRSWRR